MKIAVIGGIGSGKSAVMDCLAQLGERTCDCDLIYREIMAQPDYIELIDKNFGVVTDGKIDASELARQVFYDSKKLKLLNALAHPRIFQRVESIYNENLDKNLYVEVSAFDLDMANYFDEIVYVKSETPNRIARIKVRNNFDEDYIMSIISNQLSDEKMQAIANFVIINDSTLEELQSQVEWLTQWI